jgi:hypothetical protein
MDFSPLRRLAVRLARPDITFWVLPPLMLLLIIGTIAQKDLGLHAAHQKYFASLITFIGPVPFPGAYLLLGILFLNLLMKFLLFSEWSWKKSGIILAHFSVLLLMIGGLFTALTQKEGYMVIREGETTHIINDYEQRELMVLKDNAIILSIPYQELHNNKLIQNDALPFALTINTYCFNCNISKRPADEQDGFIGPGQFMKLSPTAPKIDYEMNLTGVEFTVEGSEISDGKYVTFDKFPKPPQINHKNNVYTIIMGREQRTVPFTLRLNNFTRTFHPGTVTSSGYESDITVTDGKESWRTTIRMNEPLRYRGYTFYQSSFGQSPDNEEFTVLSAVENKGRLFPYISSFLMFAGLLLHCILRFRVRGDLT